LTQLGSTFEAFNLDATPQAREAYIACKQIANGRADFNLVLLLGPTGVGKTHLLYATTLAACDVGVHARFYTVGGLLSLLKSAMRDEREDKDARYENLWAGIKTRWPFLVLDGIGDTQGTDWQWAILDELVDARYANHLPLVASANIDLEDLRERAPRMLSRFRDRVQGRCCIIEGLDYRLNRQGGQTS